MSLTIGRFFFILTVLIFFSLPLKLELKKINQRKYVLELSSLRYVVAKLMKEIEGIVEDGRNKREYRN